MYADSGPCFKLFRKCVKIELQYIKRRETKAEESNSVWHCVKIGKVIYSV